MMSCLLMLIGFFSGMLTGALLMAVDRWTDWRAWLRLFRQRWEK